MKTQFSDLLLLAPLFAIGWMMTVISIPIIIRLVAKYNVLVQPNWRSAHSNPTPAMGGLCFIPVLTFTILVIPHSFDTIILYTACILLALTGLLDDIKGLGARSKFTIQIIAAVLLYNAGFQFDNMKGIFGIYQLSPEVSLAFTVLIVVAIINAFNLIDGIDGLAGGLGLMNTLIFGVFLIINGDFSLAILAIAFAGSLLGFLKFNFQPAKIFMGDTGSLTLGLIMAAFFLKTFSYSSMNASVSAVALIALPMIDMARVFAIRIWNKKSPFKADKNHLHHYLLKIGHSHKTAAIWCFKTSFMLVFGSLTVIQLFNMNMTNLKGIIGNILNL